MTRGGCRDAGFLAKMDPGGPFRSRWVNVSRAAVTLGQGAPAMANTNLGFDDLVEA
jgi:hypothetical protein